MKHNPFLLAADQLKEIAFFRYGFPIITLIGGIVFFYYGFKGIFKKSTITLGRGVSSHYRPQEITGWPAQLVGGIYLILGVFLTGGLGITSYYILPT